ncbi:MAG: AAA family ATPase, partial [Clostridia bacterium]|nr:AAA family ATPase [Clostridia bacterium]
MNQRELLEILKYIDPAVCEYNAWIQVGMALKHEGLPCSVWENWSRGDGRRYHDGECERKWRGFQGSSEPVTGATIVQLAKDQGWIPEYDNSSEGFELEWDSVIGAGKPDGKVVDSAWVEPKEIPEPSDWHPAKQLITYLETLFGENELVGYVTESWIKDGKAMPTKGCSDRTAGELIRELAKCGDDVGAVLGDYDPGVGAWIRFNPLDGKGVNNANVTEFRYALVESDDMDLEKQNAMIRELELPVAALVHSGGKSLHAIVRIDADSYEQYRKRVDFLYKICKKNGMTIDSQNRNPSRLSRMPGVTRKGRKQFLVDTNIGKANWAEWQEWIEGVNDDLPDMESLSDVWGNLPELAPPLIDGVLRRGHKMLLVGPSKAGKSYALIELCIAIAGGGEWFGWKCEQGKVLYVNLELDRASCLHRFKDVYGALGADPAAGMRNIDVWNLRGKSMPMDSLAPKLIRRAAKSKYSAIIIDPIYKVITGDENSADQMARFCNQFDTICNSLGCAVIYCHHHSKGSQGQKRSMDRASGSGVFARDPDALLDMIELEVTDAITLQEENKATCSAIAAFLDKTAAGWREDAGQDDLLSSAAMERIAKDKLREAEQPALRAAVDAAKVVVKRRTAWRIEGTLREFPRFAPVNLWFDFPVHHIDRGGLQDLKMDEGGAPRKQGKPGRPSGLA